MIYGLSNDALAIVGIIIAVGVAIVFGLEERDEKPDEGIEKSNQQFYRDTKGNEYNEYFLETNDNEPNRRKSRHAIRLCSRCKGLEEYCMVEVFHRFSKHHRHLA